MDFNDVWNDDEFGQEYLKFVPADETDSGLYDDNVSCAYIEPLYDTIEDYVNQWNKSRKKIRVNKIIRCINTPERKDIVETGLNLYMDMGARLFNAVKIGYLKKMKYVKILKVSNPSDKFDVQYYISKYSLHIKGAIKTKTKK